ncbi:thiopeptide-type bacteriocin biosynthesis protein [Streptomyces sp. NPDC086549]|uniref:lantibiotic dehydratase n=1 Tax=Streptomyces sp. NPDC086549 TaxID=3365752 RepID=UPI0038102C30
MHPTVVLLRVASLSVDEVSRRGFRADRLLDDYVRQAIGLAAGSELVDATGSKAREAVDRYVARMAGRATPFGLLAGTAFAEVGEERDLQLADRRDHRAAVRLDGAALESILSAVTGREAPRLLQPGRPPQELAIEWLRRQGAANAADELEELMATACGVQPVACATPESLARAWARCSLPGMTAVKENARFHVDLDVSVAKASVEQRLVEDLDLTLRRLQTLFPAPDPLYDFRLEFQSRYEDAEVSLSTVLDPVQGLLEKTFTAASALANRAGVETARTASSELQVPDIALRAYDHWRATGQPYDLAGHAPAEVAVARSVQAALLDKHEAAFDALLLSGQQRSPLASLARFAVGRPDREHALRQWLGSDKDDGVIVAELVHTPGGRIANVLQRPALHRHTVSLDSAFQGSLALDSLLIRLVDGQFVLRDRSTGRRVLLELNSTHSVDFPGNDPRYRLLAHLSGSVGVGWKWGGLARMSHLPRVTCGRIIVRPEHWQMGSDETRRLLENRDPASHLRGLLPGIAQRRWIGCGTGDRLLPLDLQETRSANALLRRAGRRGRLEFTELPHMESPAVTGPQGAHVAEVCIPLRHRVPAERRSAVPSAPVSGGDWVYFAYHCSAFVADQVIVRAQALFEVLRSRGLAASWFYVRYGEGGHHVRVRIRPAHAQHRAGVLAELDGFGSELQSSGLVSRARSDWYVPEVSRYGGHQGLAAAEEFFRADSERVATLLSSAPSEEERLLTAVATLLHGARAFFGDGFSDDQLLGVLRRRISVRQGAGRLGSRYGDFFRARRATIEAFLATHTPCQKSIDALRHLGRSLQGETATDEGVFRAALHMHMNRLFAWDTQRLERLAYDIAARKVIERRARAQTSDGHSTGVKTHAH